ncbi:MAG: N-formylglutamate amidohydrolase [Rhodospirillales bacterium]|nr:N-formylglutamate amidohydrolase [Rhodospirillales bacterium]
MTEPIHLPFRVLAPPAETLPVVLSSPHSGRLYPSELISSLRFAPSALRPLEDGPVDRLAEGACAAGAILVAAVFPRAYVDLNRDSEELDPALIPDLAPPRRLSARVRAGLGVIPSRLGGAALYSRPLSLQAVEQRLAHAYRPYHRQLASLLMDRRRRFGASLLVDLHSMPSLLAGKGGGIVDVAIGDRFGRAAEPGFIACADRVLRQAGLSVGYNRPYAGGHITKHHGRPWDGISAVQLEFRRALFMDETTYEPRPGLGGIPELFTALVGALAQVAVEIGASAGRAALRA